MPVSASKAARQAKRAAEGKTEKKTAASKLSSKANSKANSEASSVNGDDSPPMLDGEDVDQPATTGDKMDKVQKLTEQMDKHGLSDRVTTGVLASIPSSRDAKVTSASLVFHGKVLFNDTTIELNFGRRYGLLGENGCGKSTLLKALDRREFPIPEHIDIYLLNEGAPPSDLGALEWVVKQAENEVARLEKQMEDYMETEGPDAPIVLEIIDVSSLFVPTGLLVCSYFEANRCLGPVHLPDSSLSHPHRSRLQQKDNSQEDQRYVRWMADASCSCESFVRQTVASPS